MLILKILKNFLLFLTTDSTEFLKARVMTPLKNLIHICCSIKSIELKESLTALSEKDQKFIYERIKDNQHLERLFVSFLKVIRKYDFLLKNFLNQHSLDQLIMFIKKILEQEI